MEKARFVASRGSLLHHHFVVFHSKYLTEDHIIWLSIRAFAVVYTNTAGCDMDTPT